MSRRGWQAVAYMSLLVLLAVIPPLIGNFWPQRIASYLIFGLFALSVGLITGQARLFNIGAGATFGAAAYTVAELAKIGVTNPFLLMLGALAAGLLTSWLFGIYAILTSGIEYLMLTFLTTLAFFKIPSLAPSFTGGDNGQPIGGGAAISFGINPVRDIGFYYLVLGVVALCVLLALYVMASQAGRAMRAIGANPMRGGAMGYDVNLYRVWFTLFTGLLSAVAGWLYALQAEFVFTDLLGLNNSLNGLVYALVGGIDTILGPIFGAGVLRYISETLSKQSTQSPLFIGAVLMFIVYVMPDGLAGLWNTISARRGGIKEPPSP
ncbi:MAG: branched-chain amino acid ABC transporter permease [Chloroflexi bacterium]|nr:branched-chain amino acid ABC transporter permease [Chloroflexota bacterium]